ncbi:CPBP family intramembrane glutamic endopeptidase [Pleomorphovibrio marinus]|uniref:CPBP family intramembrane glutamic endopeptidase n=1 Tax=Pleomorphovibrio marinus TaxID=2164132 RepID=UPI000E0A09AC|nr:CPBP family intramembrane glutamic endopeptidase [Pleomorphovibrio marinus]
MNDFITKRNLTIFCIVALLIGWVGVGIDRLTPDQGAEEESLGMAVWLVFPLLLVVLLRGLAGDGWKDACFRPRFIGNGKWYFIAFAIFPAVTALTLLLGKLTNLINFDRMDWSAFSLVFLSLLGVNVIKNFFEESVWRGYLSAKLAKLSLSDFKLYLIVGLVWGLWHVPYYMVFLPDEMIYTVLPVDRVLFTLVAVVNMIVWTVMFVEIFFITGSIWSVVLLHAVEDALINPLVIDGFIQITPNAEWLVSPISGIFPMLCYLGIGFWLRKQRKMLGGRYSRLVPATT